MRRSYGFCPRHARHLLAAGAASQIGTVYGHVIDEAVQRLRKAEAALEMARRKGDGRTACRQADAILRPQGRCDACEQESWSSGHNVWVLLSTLYDQEVRRAYQASTGLCLRHFLEAEEKACWDDLQFLSGVMCDRLQNRSAPAPGVPEGFTPSTNGDAGSPSRALVTMIAGRDLDVSARRVGERFRASEPPTPTRQRPPLTLGVGEAWDPTEENRTWTWSPTQAEALALLGEHLCPVCTLCARGLEEYFQWLIREVRREPAPGSRDFTRDLCPRHLWDLATYECPEVLEAIGVADAARWAGRLAGFLQKLEDRPPRSLAGRLIRVPADWRKNCEAADQAKQGGRPVFRLWQTFLAALEPPERTLARLRRFPLLPDRCVACDHMATTIQRAGELFLRLLENPEALRIYHRSAGVCFRHFLQVAEQAERPEVLAEVLRAQVVRLEVLAWELDEFGRKQSWSVRFESKRGEFTSWRRAAYQMAGSILRVPQLVGL